MATYAILATLTRSGAEDIKGIAERRSKNIEDLKQAGIRIVADYALMGQYDFLYIVEAPDNVSVLKQIIKDASVGTLQFQTLPAVPMEEFVALAKDL